VRSGLKVLSRIEKVLARLIPLAREVERMFREDFMEKAKAGKRKSSRWSSPGEKFMPPGPPNTHWRRNILFSDVDPTDSIK
jgi:hypothetical protein